MCPFYWSDALGASAEKLEKEILKEQADSLNQFKSIFKTTLDQIKQWHEQSQQIIHHETSNSLPEVSQLLSNAEMQKLLLDIQQILAQYSIVEIKQIELLEQQARLRGAAELFGYFKQYMDTFNYHAAQSCLKELAKQFNL